MNGEYIMVSKQCPWPISWCIHMDRLRNNQADIRDWGFSVWENETGEWSKEFHGFYHVSETERVSSADNDSLSPIWIETGNLTSLNEAVCYFSQ